MLWVLICTVHFTVCYFYVTHEFQSESTLYSLPECQGTPCRHKAGTIFSKQAPYLKFKWQCQDSNPQPFSRKRTLNHLTKLSFFKKRPLGRLRTKWLWVRILLLSLTLQILRLLQAKSSLTFRQTIECRFTLTLVCDMIIIYNLWNIVFQNTFSKHSTSSTHLPKTKVQVAKV